MEDLCGLGANARDLLDTRNVFARKILLSVLYKTTNITIHLYLYIALGRIALRLFNLNIQKAREFRADISWTEINFKNSPDFNELQ